MKLQLALNHSTNIGTLQYLQYYSVENEGSHLIFVDGHLLLKRGGVLPVEWLPFISSCSTGFS